MLPKTLKLVISKLLETLMLNLKNILTQKDYFKFYIYFIFKFSLILYHKYMHICCTVLKLLLRYFSHVHTQTTNIYIFIFYKKCLLKVLYNLTNTILKKLCILSKVTVNIT